jgi:protein-tyrosine-phosphatase
MKRKVPEKRNVTPEQAVKVLRKNGIEVDENQAKIILDFMYIMAKLTLKQYFNDK